MELIRDERGLGVLRERFGGVGSLVPTMGALHAGHRALIGRAVRERGAGGGGAVVVSVFVNPAQFDEASDFEAYPRALERDMELAGGWGGDAVFAPSVETVYPGWPGGPEIEQGVDLPEVVVGKGLEDEYRPGHFAGVYRVCRRLFELVGPGCAVFGEKDWQQLKLVEAMSDREGLGVRVVGEPTVREGGDLRGLALSSRNVHLGPGDREAALGLSRGIAAARDVGRAGGSAAEAEAAARVVMERSGARVEYAAVRDAMTCGAVVEGEPARVLVAARVGVTRLIDNDAWV